MSSYKASMVKKMGHNAEVQFNFLFGDKSLEELNFSGASEDCVVKKEHFIERIQNDLNYFEDYLGVSLKSGKTWQFHLGKINEISTLEYIKEHISTKVLEDGKELTVVKYSKTFEEQKKELSSKSFWKKYLKKGNLLCYNDKAGNYTFFEMDKVIEAIINGVNWRILESGRIKGDFEIKGKLCRGVITLEYRNEEHKKSLVLGSSGGNGNNANGYRLFLYLKETIKNTTIRPLD